MNKTVPIPRKSMVGCRTVMQNHSLATGMNFDAVESISFKS